jgi:hypothetical protein
MKRIATETVTTHPTETGLYWSDWSNNQTFKEIIISDKLTLSGKSIFDLVYPVGCIYESTSSTVPNTLFGGTWERFGNGRVLIGVNSSDTVLSSSNNTGGSENPLSAHSHTVNPPNTTTSSSGNHAHSIDPPSTSTNTTGGHQHKTTVASVIVPHISGSSGYAHPTSGGHYFSSTVQLNAQSTSVEGNHSHTVDIASFNSSTTGAHTHTFDIAEFNSGTKGSNSNHDNWQPFITVYRWRRTA